MIESRIPKISGTSKRAAIAWLIARQRQQLLFCIDDDPYSVTRIADGQRTFTDQEAAEVTKAIAALFSFHGDAVYELAFSVVSKRFHLAAERQAFEALNA